MILLLLEIISVVYTWTSPGAHNLLKSKRARIFLVDPIIFWEVRQLNPTENYGPTKKILLAYFQKIMGPRRCPRIYYSYNIKVVMKSRSYGVNERRYGLCWNGVCSRYAKFWVSIWHCFYRRAPIRRCLLLRIRQNSWFHWLEFSKERIFYLLYY